MCDQRIQWLRWLGQGWLGQGCKHRHDIKSIWTPPGQSSSHWSENALRSGNPTPRRPPADVMTSRSRHTYPTIYSISNHIGHPEDCRPVLVTDLSRLQVDKNRK